MLNFFRNLRDQFQAKPPPEIDVTGYDHDQATLVFQNYRQPTRHLMEEATDRETGKVKPVELIAHFPDGQTVEATLQYLSFDPEDGKHTARVVTPVHMDKMLEVAFPKPEPPEEEQGPPEEERRQHFRLKRVLGVISQKLPGFKAVTHEISIQGVRLDTDAAVEPGTVIPFKLELDDPRIEPMEIRGTVIWCREKPKHERVHWVGMKFGTIAPEDLELLGAFIEERKEAEFNEMYEL